MKKKPKGIALAGVVGIITVLMILLPVLISWLQQDTKMSIKAHKSTLAFNLAEAGIDRGMWKLKSSTATFATARKGTAITGYNFDTAYEDITGGRYRINIQRNDNEREVPPRIESTEPDRELDALLEKDPLDSDPLDPGGDTEDEGESDEIVPSLSSNVQPEAIVITGICGRMGRLVARRLHREYPVIGIDRRKLDGKPEDIVHYQMDLRRRKTRDIFRAANPFIIMGLLALIAVFLFPALATWLPKILD